MNRSTLLAGLACATLASTAWSQSAPVRVRVQREAPTEVRVQTDGAVAREHAVRIRRSQPRVIQLDGEGGKWRTDDGRVHAFTLHGDAEGGDHEVHAFTFGGGRGEWRADDGEVHTFEGAEGAWRADGDHEVHVFTPNSGEWRTVTPDGAPDHDIIVRRRGGEGQDAQPRVRVFKGGAQGEWRSVKPDSARDHDVIVRRPQGQGGEQRVRVLRGPGSRQEGQHKIEIRRRASEGEHRIVIPRDGHGAAHGLFGGQGAGRGRAPQGARGGAFGGIQGLPPAPPPPVPEGLFRKAPGEAPVRFERRAAPRVRAPRHSNPI